MISIIVCSRSLQFFNALSTNIQETIGTPFEIIRIDNSNRSYSICEAYNEGAAQAKFSYLCFVHEDVVFKTQNWGVNFINHFSQTDVGLIGVAGSVYKSKMACGWWQFENGSGEIRRMNILQSGKGAQNAMHLFINPFNETRSDAVLIDGVFMGSTKETWRQNKFDEKVFKGFHAYDLDFSFQVGHSKKIQIVYDILIEHFSAGTCDLNWMTEMMKLHKKWKNELPFKSRQFNIEPSMIYKHSRMRLRKNMGALINYNCSLPFILKKYALLFALIDNKPRFVTAVKDFMAELIKITNVYLSKRGIFVMRNLHFKIPKQQYNRGAANIVDQQAIG